MSDHQLEHTDPSRHPGGIVGFDYDAVFRALGEQVDDDRIGDMADALLAVMGWVTAPAVDTRWENTPPPKRVALSGRRALVAVWCVRPELFPGATLESVAHRFGVKPERMHELSAEFSRQFGIRNRMQISRASSVAARQVKMHARKADSAVPNAGAA